MFVDETQNLVAPRKVQPPRIIAAIKFIIALYTSSTMNVMVVSSATMWPRILSEEGDFKTKRGGDLDFGRLMATSFCKISK